MTPNERISRLVSMLARAPETNAKRVELSQRLASEDPATVDAALEARLVQWRALSRSRSTGRYPPALYLTRAGHKHHRLDQRRLAEKTWRTGAVGVDFAYGVADE